MKPKFLLEQGHGLILGEDWFSARQQLSNLSHCSCGHGKKTIKRLFFFLSFLIRESAISVLNIRALDPFFFFFFSRRIHDGAGTEHGKNHQPLKAICLTRWWLFKTVRPLCHLCPSHSVPGTSRCASLCAPDCFLTLFTAISPYLRPPY